MRPEAIAFPDDIPVRAFVLNVAGYPYHWHNALEIIYVLEGLAFVGMGSENHLLEKNNIVIINTDELHRIHKSSEDSKLLVIQMDSAFCERVNPDYKYAFIYCCSLYHEAEAPEKYNELKGHIARLVYQLNQKPCKNHKKDIKDCLEKILSHMIYSFDYLRFGPGIKAFEEKQAERLRKMYKHILKSPTGKQGLKELAEVTGITLHHMSHDIKEKFGYTFQELLYYSKCEHAARMILSTNKHIREVSAECGFSDPKYLIKHFKLNYRCTPSQFRKMYQAEDEILASQVQCQEASLSSALEYMALYINY
ncbi:helix-turn-helix domain-containing protein [Geosporobacter ferrireducens]|uniref:AraC family transcriptional regulator n=1 Tax=Geosporobacter ferrireducens TaxID=1424294 RepID=A0A1D8GM31_9FIRM|nr:AraC family transcriptional regulator [Geosporobacter ferrireducens]AOT71974.1 AraC family transcriptional regulator [Geosporobacter ferrireducens]MTI55842.1 AraC family transcriptional regulator [Geosporobacter ferrireducens]